MFEDINRHAMFHEMHRSIEDAASTAVKRLMEGKLKLSYPPNGGLLLDELEALTSLPQTPALERALRKLIADAAVYPLFHLFCLIDGVADVPELDDIEVDESILIEDLHDGLYGSYWTWRRRRPDPGWKLDILEE